MTDHSNAPRPHQVFFRAPAIGTYLDPTEITRKTFIDSGLTHDDVIELVHPETVRRLNLMGRLLRGSTLIFCLWLGLTAYGVTGLVSGSAHPLLAGTAVAAALALAAFVIRVKAQATSSGDKLQALQKDLITSGRLTDADVLTDSMHTDLERIHAALTVLQKSHGTTFDNDALAATIAVLRRNVHEPSKVQREIADSSATDEHSNKIRAIVTASNAKWRSDVALAEHLILTLEEAAVQKTPAA